MLTLLVDFNAVREGLVRGLSKELSGTGVVEKERILLSDGEGNQTLGTVSRIEPDLIFAEVDWDTWGPEGYIVTTSFEPERNPVMPGLRIDGAEPQLAFAQMRIDTALLCDAATVREGLLNVLGGGITVAQRPEFPAPLGMTLAMRVLLHPTEVEHSHKLEILLQDEDGQQITKAELQIEVGDPSVLPPGEEASVPIPWDFPARPALPHEGRYSFEILIDGVHQLSLPFTAVKIELPQGGDAA